MKIVHICLCGPVTDDWNYQDNLLTKYHAKLGYEVSIITSQWVWNQKGELVTDRRTEYINSDGVFIKRLKIKGKNNFYKKFKRFENFQETLNTINPDILFVHGCQFLDIDLIVRYIRKNSHIKVFVDNHADFSNSATNLISKNILHKLIWKSRAKLIEPYVEKFYGVLPARVDFLVDIYKINKEKVELLVMGADDEKVQGAQENITKKDLRGNFDIKEDDFLIVTGGKIDIAKSQTLLLMKAICEIPNEKVKLLVFGSVAKELKEEFNSLIDNTRIYYAGWIKPEETYDYFAIADLIVFPGRHSVFWEQAVGQGIPMVVKYWEGTTHIDVGGNVNFIFNDTVDEMIEKIVNITQNKKKYINMKKVAMEKGLERFSYKEIAKKSVDFNIDKI